MGADWRTAFCTASLGVDADERESSSPTGLKSCAKFGFFSSASTTPRSSSSMDPSTKSVEALDAEPRLTSSPLSSRMLFDFWKSGFQSESVSKGMKKTAASTSPTVRCYRDDEPLTSPGLRNSRFCTIPEECEEEGEDFKEIGDASNDRERHHPYERSGRVRVGILPERAVISSNRSYETHVALLTVKAAPLQLGATRRVPVDLVVVLDLNCDTSWDKLEILKAAMNLVIASLGWSDRLSIVAFADHSKRVLALKRMTARGRRMARVTVDCLLRGTQRGRCVRDALRKASKVLEDRCEKNPVSSILLLSDIRKEELRVADLLSESMRSSECKTRFAHIEISREPNSGLSKEFLAGILNVVVQDLKIDLGFPESVGSAEVTAVYARNKGQCTLLGSGSIWLGDLFAEEERELLVEMRIPYSSAIGSNLLMIVHCCYNNPACGEVEVVHCEDQKVLVYRPRFAEQSPSPRSERLRNVFITTRAIAESKRSVDRDDYGGARRLIGAARALMMRSGSPSGMECVKALEAEFTEIYQRNQKKMEMASMFYRKQVKDAHPRSWRTVEKLADIAMMKRSLNRVGDLHGFELARF